MAARHPCPAAVSARVWTYTADGAQIFSPVTLVPSSDTPAIRPALVSTKTCTGAVAVDVSILPFAPTFTTATVASAPTAHPSLLRKRSKQQLVSDLYESRMQITRSVVHDLRNFLNAFSGSP